MARDSGLPGINGASVSSAKDDDVYDLVVRVAATDVTIDELAHSLHQLHDHTDG